MLHLEYPDLTPKNLTLSGLKMWNSRRNNRGLVPVERPRLGPGISGTEVTGATSAMIRTYVFFGKQSRVATVSKPFFVDVLTIINHQNNQNPVLR